MSATLAISDAEVAAAVEAIAAAIETDGWRPELLAGIGRGGLAPAAMLSHRLSVPMVSIDLSAAVSGFGRDLLPALAAAAATRELLVIDDINDSGHTLAALRDALGTGPRFAVLIHNRRSPAPVDYRGRVIDRHTEARWLVFPWEQLAPAATIQADAEARR